MSKLVRPLLVLLALSAGLLACVLVAALQPPVQRWALRRALAGRPDLRLEFAHIAAGLSRAELRGVVFARPGLRVRAEEIEADYALWRFVLQNRLEISRLAVRGLEVELTGVSAERAGAGAAGGSAVIPGALAQQALPWGIVLGRVEVAGRALLPAAPGRAALPVDLEIRGGDLAPEREGTLHFKLTVRDATPGARVTALRAEGQLRLRETGRRTFDQAALTLAVDAEGPRLAPDRQLQLDARMVTAAGGARYSLDVDMRQDGRTENLVALEANAPAQQPRFAGRWSVHMTDSQLESFVLGGALPKFTVEGSGAFGFHTDTGEIAVDGALRGTASSLEAIDPSLRALGLLRWDAQLDLAAEPGRIEVRRLAAKIENERPVAAVELKRGLTVDRRRRQLQLAAGEGEVGRLALHGLPLAWVRPFVRAADVSGGALTGELVVTGDARHLRIESAAPLRAGGLSLVRQGALLLDRADLSAHLAATVAPDQVALRVQNFSLVTPAADRVRAELQVDLPLPDPAKAWTVRMSGDADLPHLLGAFTPFGHLRAAGSVDLGYTGDRLEVRAFRGELSSGAGRRFFVARGEKPFAFDLLRLQLIQSGADETELARVTFERVALADLAAPAARLPVEGEIASGGFVVAAKGPRLFFRPTAPVRLGGLGWTRAGRRMVEGLAVQSSPTLEFGGVGDWKISDGATTVRDRAGAGLVELNLEASAGAEGLRASASFDANLAALGGQPLLASLQTLGAGRASGELRAAVAGRAVQVEVRSTMNGLVAREDNQALPVANLSLRAVRSSDGRVAIEAPLLLDRLGQRSNLKLTVDAVPQGGVLRADARLAGDHLELADALALLALAGGSGATSSAPAAEPAAPGPVTADARPFWSGWSGGLAVEVKEIVRGRDWALRDFTVSARIEPAVLRLEKLAGVINGRGVLAGQAELGYRAGATPYALRGGFSLGEFDVGALLRAFEPDRPPVLEGVFAVEGKLAGAGRTLDDTLARTRGSFELRSRAGVFRGLRRTSDKVSVATKAVDAVAALGSLLGTSKVKEAAEKVAGQTYQIDQLAQALAELPFDQCVLRAARDERLDYRIDELSVVSPEVRLNARGTVTHVAGQPLLEQPLSLDYQLAARGRIEQTLGRLRALDGTRDELGYARAKNLGTITGTVARPQTFLYGEILKLAESKLGDLLN